MAEYIVAGGSHDPSRCGWQQTGKTKRQIISIRYTVTQTRCVSDSKQHVVFEAHMLVAHGGNRCAERPSPKLTFCRSRIRMDSCSAFVTMAFTSSDTFLTLAYGGSRLWRSGIKHNLKWLLFGVEHIELETAAMRGFNRKLTGQRNRVTSATTVVWGLIPSKRILQHEQYFVL